MNTKYLHAARALRELVTKNSTPSDGLREAAETFLDHIERTIAGSSWCSGECTPIRNLRAALATTGQHKPNNNEARIEYIARAAMLLYSLEDELEICPDCGTKMKDKQHSWQCDFRGVLETLDLYLKEAGYTGE